MSPRAAARFDSLGFTQAFDYKAGKQDWFASGLPREGREAQMTWAGDVARKDSLTCRLTWKVGDIRQSLQATGQSVCPVVNDQGVVLGLLGKDALASDPQSSAEQVMQEGPRTFRPYNLLEKVTGYMREHDMEAALITSSDGVLLGMIFSENKK